MSSLALFQSKESGGSVLVLTNKDVQEWKDLNSEIKAGLDDKGNILQIKTVKPIKIVKLTKQSKVDKVPLNMALGEYGMSYLYINTSLKYKGTKVGDKSVYGKLGVFVDLAEDGRIIGIEFNEHPQEKDNR